MLPAFASLLLIGCATDDSLVACTGLVEVSVIPASRTIAVGETFTPTSVATGCAADAARPFTIRWRSGSPQVVVVDSLSGSVRGISPGQTIVHVDYFSGAVLRGADTLTVSVR